MDDGVEGAHRVRLVEAGRVDVVQDQAGLAGIGHAEEDGQQVAQRVEAVGVVAEAHVRQVERPDDQLGFHPAQRVQPLLALAAHPVPVLRLLRADPQQDVDLAADVPGGAGVVLRHRQAQRPGQAAHRLPDGVIQDVVIEDVVAVGEQIGPVHRLVDLQQPAFVGVLVAQPQQGLFQTGPDPAQEVGILAVPVMVVVAQDVPQVAIHATGMSRVGDGALAVGCRSQPPAQGDQRRVIDVGEADVVRDLAQRALELAQRFQRAAVNAPAFAVLAQLQPQTGDHAVPRPDLLVGLAGAEDAQLVAVADQDGLGDLPALVDEFGIHNIPFRKGAQRVTARHNALNSTLRRAAGDRQPPSPSMPGAGGARRHPCAAGRRSAGRLPGCPGRSAGRSGDSRSGSARSPAAPAGARSRPLCLRRRR